MSISNHLSHLLANWYPTRDDFSWVLATIYKTIGPCYRKPGAMMLFSSQGEQLGMLSGGCLESDISVNARKVMQTGQPLLVCYDGSDEDELSFHLGIGCGGTIYIMLQQISNQNEYLSLVQVYDALKQRSSGMVTQLHLALVMAIDVELLVIDEPTIGLDILYRKEFFFRILGFRPRQKFFFSFAFLDKIAHHFWDVFREINFFQQPKTEKI